MPKTLATQCGASGQDKVAVLRPSRSAPVVADSFRALGPGPRHLTRLRSVWGHGWRSGSRAQEASEWAQQSDDGWRGGSASHAPLPPLAPVGGQGASNSQLPPLAPAGGSLGMMGGMQGPASVVGRHSGSGKRYDVLGVGVRPEAVVVVVVVWIGVVIRISVLVGIKPPGVISFACVSALTRPPTDVA